MIVGKKEADVGIICGIHNTDIKRGGVCGSKYSGNTDRHLILLAKHI